MWSFTEWENGPRNSRRRLWSIIYSSLWMPAYGVKREWQGLCPHRTYHLRTTVNSKATLKYDLLCLDCTLYPERVRMIKQLLLNQRKDGRSQVYAYEWKMETDPPAVYCKEPQNSVSGSPLSPWSRSSLLKSPAGNSQAKTRSQDKYHPEKGQMQMWSGCILMYEGCFSTGMCFEKPCFNSKTNFC